MLKAKNDALEQEALALKHQTTAIHRLVAALSKYICQNTNLMNAQKNEPL